MVLKWEVTAFMIIMLLCVLMVQVITATALMEEIHKLRGEVGMLWENQVTECYEKIEEITRMTLNHANAVERENEKLRRETEVIAQAATQLQEENRRFREGSNGDEI